MPRFFGFRTAISQFLNGVAYYRSRSTGTCPHSVGEQGRIEAHPKRCCAGIPTCYGNAEGYSRKSCRSSRVVLWIISLIFYFVHVGLNNKTSSYSPPSSKGFFSSQLYSSSSPILLIGVQDPTSISPSHLSPPTLRYPFPSFPLLCSHLRLILVSTSLHFTPFCCFVVVFILLIPSAILYSAYSTRPISFHSSFY